MRDMHRERLTHLLANAILELWKKETGSLSSVIIEGTICITSSTGKTTVLQVADRFTGSIPEACENELGHSFSPPEPNHGGRYSHHQGVMRSLSMPPCYNETAPPRVDCQNQAAMAAFLDNLSPASLVSPGTEYSRSSQERRSPSSSSHPVSREHDNSRNNHNTSEGQNMDVSSGSVKEEMSESGSDTMNDEKNGSGSGEAPTGGICPGTGYYTCATANTPTQELNNNTIDPKHALKFHKGRSPQDSPDRNNKRRRSRERSPPLASDGAPSASTTTLTSSSDRKRASLDAQKSTSPMGNVSYDRSRESSMGYQASSDAMDLTRKGVDDLALSPPHSYTAQVRDIIRQRVLAAQTKGSSESEIVERLKEGDQHNPQAGSSTPKVLESLGLHRSDGEGEGQSERGRHPLDRSLEEQRGRDAGLDKVVTSSPGELRVAVGGGLAGGRRNSHASHPMLPAPISPIVSSTGMVMVGGAPMMTSHSPLSSPSGSISSSSSSGSSSSSSNGPLHNILTQHPHHRLYLPLTPLQRPPPSLGHSGPSSAPPVFTHPGFSPLSLSQPPNSSQTPRDASPSPTDLSLDSSGESEKELGPNGEQRVYRCEFCTKTFLFKSKYHEHLPVHTNARPFQCHLCSRTYKYKYDLRVHLRTHMGIPTKSTVCPFCNTKFDTNKRLRVHIKDAHKDKQKVTEDDCTQTQDNLPPAL